MTSSQPGPYASRVMTSQRRVKKHLPLSAYLDKYLSALAMNDVTKEDAKNTDAIDDVKAQDDAIIDAKRSRDVGGSKKITKETTDNVGKSSLSMRSHVPTRIRKKCHAGVTSDRDQPNRMESRREYSSPPQEGSTKTVAGSKQCFKRVLKREAVINCSSEQNATPICDKAVSCAATAGPDTDANTSGAVRLYSEVLSSRTSQKTDTSSVDEGDNIDTKQDTDLISADRSDGSISSDSEAYSAPIVPYTARAANNAAQTRFVEEGAWPAQVGPVILRPIPQRFMAFIDEECRKKPVENYRYFTGQWLLRQKPIGSRKRKEAMEALKRQKHEQRIRQNTIATSQLNPCAAEFEPKFSDDPNYDSGYSAKTSPNSSPPPNEDSQKKDSETEPGDKAECEKRETSSETTVCKDSEKSDEIAECENLDNSDETTADKTEDLTVDCCAEEVKSGCVEGEATACDENQASSTDVDAPLTQSKDMSGSASAGHQSETHVPVFPKFEAHNPPSFFPVFPAPAQFVQFVENSLESGYLSLTGPVGGGFPNQEAPQQVMCYVMPTYPPQVAQAQPEQQFVMYAPPAPSQPQVLAFPPPQVPYTGTC